MIRTRPTLLSLLLLLAAAAPVMAGEARLEGWGPRVGLADDPDQAVVGVHFEVGRINRFVRIVPNLELGVGDDHTTFVVTAPVHYVWRNGSYDAKPYAGGGVSFGLVDSDRGRRGDDTDFEAAIRAIGGVEWEMQRGYDFFLEMNLIFGDLHDIQFMAGWTFRGRGSRQP